MADNSRKKKAVSILLVYFSVFGVLDIFGLRTHKLCSIVLSFLDMNVAKAIDNQVVNTFGINHVSCSSLDPSKADCSSDIQISSLSHTSLGGDMSSPKESAKMSNPDMKDKLLEEIKSIEDDIDSTVVLIEEIETIVEENVILVVDSTETVVDDTKIKKEEKLADYPVKNCLLNMSPEKTIKAPQMPIYYKSPKMFWKILLGFLNDIGMEGYVYIKKGGEKELRLYNKAFSTYLLLYVFPKGVITSAKEFARNPGIKNIALMIEPHFDQNIRISIVEIEKYVIQYFLYKTSLLSSSFGKNYNIRLKNHNNFLVFFKEKSQISNTTQKPHRTNYV
ncbi:hypothetical protein NECID01_1325 [Nematocida sp. AWRm77]|nr:hypothetical protein NECID01_1325 [Nematocida sp. AWRm77]